MKTPKSSKKSRWKDFESSTFIPPDPETPAATIISNESPSAEECLEAAGSISYPRLRIHLRDCEKAFRPIFAQGDAAAIFGKNSRTIRNWIYRGQVPFHRWPSGEPYFSPQDLEDIITGGTQIVDGSK
jgi:hypothetical protein